MNVRLIRSLVLTAAMLVCNTSHAQLEKTLSGEFDLSSPRSQVPRYYIIEIDRTDRTVAGEVTDRGGTRLAIEYRPETREWICRRFEVTRNGGLGIRVSEVEGYSYTYQPGQDEAGQVFGLDHARFDTLTDEQGESLTVIEHYWVYNTFVDFHSFADYFVTPPKAGHGIQDLVRVGDRVVHVASHSSPPVDLNDDIGEGSTFTNGEIILAFEGLGLEHDNVCALVSIDSGDSSLDMNMNPVPGVDLHVIGYSRYRGRCSINLESHWIERFVGSEVVSTAMTGTTPAGELKRNSVSTVERRIKSVSAQEFAAERPQPEVPPKPNPNHK